MKSDYTDLGVRPKKMTGSPVAATDGHGDDKPSYPELCVNCEKDMGLPTGKFHAQVHLEPTSHTHDMKNNTHRYTFAVHGIKQIAGKAKEEAISNPRQALERAAARVTGNAEASSDND